MHEMQTIGTNDPGVCLSRGSTPLHCARMAERTKMLFGVNSPGGPWNITLDVGPDSLTVRGRGLDAAFTKLLWPLVINASFNSNCPKLVLDRYCVSVSIHSLLYSIGEYDISVCVSPPIPIRPLQ